MYAKVFRQIYESSIAEDYQTRHVFMDMIVLADSDGVVDMTQEAIARITNVPLERVKAAIVKLEAPDPRSRTPDNEGSRLIRLDDHRDWGWIIVNYAKFRGTSTDDKRRELTKLRVRKLRLKQQTQGHSEKCVCDKCNALRNVTHGYPPSPSPSVLTPGNGGVMEGDANIPSQEEVIAYGAKNNVDLGICKRFFIHHQGGNIWINQFNRLIDWRVKLLGWRDDPRNQVNGKAIRVYPRDIKLQMDAIQVQIDQHPANPSSVFKVNNPTELQRASLRSLRKQWNDLNQQQANGICGTTQ